ncbi:LysB family phage lysis regulatory protein [Pseudomonas graminis]|nr:LysB family phage lysis regulatory protein [Pseudomonas graminis]
MSLEPVVAVAKVGSTLRAIAVGIVIVIVMGLLIAIQQIRVVTLQGAVTVEAKAKQEAVDANKESQLTITTLRAEAERNAAYTSDLSKRIKASEDKAKKAKKDFDDLKRNSKPVRDWAAQPLPDGLRGKAASGNKDNSHKAGSP